jgi:hypothetical protein
MSEMIICSPFGDWVNIKNHLFQTFKAELGHSGFAIIKFRHVVICISHFEEHSADAVIFCF